MSRAPVLEAFSEQEFKLSREYLKGALAAPLGAKLVDSDDGKWLVNASSGSTYNTYLIGKPDPQLGMVRVVIDHSTLTPMHGKAGASWLVLHNPHLNKAWVISWANFLRWVGEVSKNPQYQSALMRLRSEGTNLHILLNLDWAARVGLIRSALDLPKGEFLQWRDGKLAAKEDFCHLHNHSTYSLLDGVSTIDDIADQAVLNGQPGIALTDHGNVFGARKHWDACMERGIRPVSGIEMYMVDDVTQNYSHNGTLRRFEYHQTILAMNETGWKNLSKLITIGGRDHFLYVPRIDHKLLLENSEGLIVLSGCFKGMVAHYLQTRPIKEGEIDLPPWLRRDPDESRRIMRMYKAALGDRYYVEVMNIDYAPYMQIVPEILEMAHTEGVPLVLTNDCHYPRPEDAILQAAMSRISKTNVDGLGDAMMEKGVYYIRSKAEMQVGAPWATDEMCARSVEIMNRCNMSFERTEFLFPHYDLEKDCDWAAYQASKSASAQASDQLLATTAVTPSSCDSFLPKEMTAIPGHEGLL